MIHSSSVIMSAITKALIVARVRSHITKVCKSGNEFEKGLTKFLTTVIEEEYTYIQSILNKNNDTESNESLINSRKQRKVSEYVLFCRYMKENHPEQLRLQNV